MDKETGSEAAKYAYKQALAEIERLKKERDIYALGEMTNLLRNMQLRPIQCYSQKPRGGEKQFFLGRKFIDDLIIALENQYKPK